ncbi:TonB-dependent receptor plug domain-containing protein [Bacteroidota bacterium]
MTRIFLTISGTLLFTVVLSWEAAAQIDTTRISFLEMSLEELLDQEVVSASRIEEKGSEAPATIHVITESQIRTRGYVNLEEILDDIPEVEIQKKASVEYSNYFTIRGIDGSEKFIIMMDGMRINSPTGTPLAIVYNYPIMNARQVEIILGPASALYGVDAFTGVINIITKKGSDAKGLQLSGSYGNYNTSHNTFVAGIGNENISFSLSGSYFFSDEPYFPDIYKEEYRWYNEQYKNTGAMLVSPWNSSVVNMPVKDYNTPTNSYAVHAKLNIHDFEVGYFRNYESHSSSISTLPEYTVYSEEASFKFLVESFYSSYNFISSNEKWRLLTTLSHSRDEIDPRSLYINTYTSYNKGYKYAFNRSLKLSEQVTYLFSESSSIIAGITYEDITALPKTGDLPFAFDRDLAADFQNIYYLGTNIVDQNGNDLSISQDFYYLQYQNLGTYFQWRTTLADKFSLTLGGRFDFNTRYMATLNPRAGLVYTPFEKIKIKILYGKAYLSPSPYRHYQHYGSFQPTTDSITGGVSGLTSGFWRLPAEKLEAQKISTYEAGFSYAINRNLILAVNGFFNDMNDILSSEGYSGQSFKGIPVGIIERPVNKGNAISYGGTARLDFKKNWSALTLNSHLAYTFVDGEIDGRQIPFAARHTVKALVDLDFKRFSTSLRYIHRSESYHRSLKDASGNLMSSDPYGIVNLSARYTLFNRGNFSTEFFLKVNNLLNRRYYNVPIGGAESIRMAPQDPIRLLLGLQFQI